MDLATETVCRSKASSIRLLSCFIVNEQSNSFDLLAANGRAEILKKQITFS